MKLIVSDLDGTLLNNKSKISRENIEALKHAKSEGIEIVIASGRTYADVHALCKEANISPYIISNNGACIWSKNGEKIKGLRINDEDVIEVMDYLVENEICYQMATYEKLHLPENWKGIFEKEYMHLKKPIEELNLNHTISTILSQKGVYFTKNYREIVKKESDFYTLSVVSFDKAKLHKAKNILTNLKT